MSASALQKLILFNMSVTSSATDRQPTDRYVQSVGLTHDDGQTAEMLTVFSAKVTAAQRHSMNGVHMRRCPNTS